MTDFAHYYLVHVPQLKQKVLYTLTTTTFITVRRHKINTAANRWRTQLTREYLLRVYLQKLAETTFA